MDQPLRSSTNRVTARAAKTMVRWASMESRLQLRVDLRHHWSSADFGESVPLEEGHGEGQDEYSRHTELPGADEQLVHDQVADAAAPLLSSTARVRISARSSHITCSAPHPATAPSTELSATQNSWMSS